MGSETKKICIELPDHLVDFVETFSRLVAMTPNQLLAHILKYYYDAFKVGRDSAILEQLEERVKKQVEKLLDEFTRNYRGHETHIVKKFTKWVIDNAKKLGELGENDIEEFLRLYSMERSISSSSVSKYRRLLKKFLEYAKESCERV
jgi:hypothetical protein